MVYKPIFRSAEGSRIASRTMISQMTLSRSAHEGTHVTTLSLGLNGKYVRPRLVHETGRYGARTESIREDRTMAIRQQTTSVRSQEPQQLKRTSTQAGAIAAQQKALTSVEPRDRNESSALHAQQRLLGAYASTLPQRTAVESRYQYLQAQQLSSSRAPSSFAHVSSAAQIRALATTENRERLLAAVRYAVGMWRLQAHFQNITIMSVNAIGVPGCLNGPQLAPWIAQAPGVSSATGYLQTLVNAVASGVSTNFSAWQSSVTVPGLPWYPAFAAWPGPSAPPTPNVPMPLIACLSTQRTKLITGYQVEQAIKSELGSEFDLPEINQFLTMLCIHLANYFVTWMSSQRMTLVMGMGPVPSFAPPAASVGPVVAGHIIPAPGHFAS